MNNEQYSINIYKQFSSICLAGLIQRIFDSFGRGDILLGIPHFVSVFPLNADDHEGAIAFQFAVFNLVTKSATACERGLAKIFLVFFFFQGARTQILCKHRGAQKHQCSVHIFGHKVQSGWRMHRYTDGTSETPMKTHEWPYGS